MASRRFQDRVNGVKCSKHQATSSREKENLKEKAAFIQKRKQLLASKKNETGSGGSHLRKNWGRRGVGEEYVHRGDVEKVLEQLITVTKIKEENQIQGARNTNM